MKIRVHGLFVLLACLSACAGAPVPPGPEGAYERAVALCIETGEAGAVAALREALAADARACQRALLEPAFHRGLRDRPEFRQAIHDAAMTHGISRLDLVAQGEPGEWLEIEGRVVDDRGAPVPGAVVRLFATDAGGRYHPTLEGERTPRIFGTLVADGEGRFVFRTVRPGPYPGTRQCPHVHVSVRCGDLRLAAPGYVVFDDDPLLDEPQNAEQRGEALRIEMTTTGGASVGRLALPLR